MRKMLLAVLLLVPLGLPHTGSSQGITLPPGATWFDFGKAWRTSSEVARQAYLSGFMDGADRGYHQTLDLLGKGWTREQFMPAYEATHPPYDVDVLSRVISSFYSDPANTFILRSALIDIARAKLDGKDVEPLLRAARVEKRTYIFPNP